jgi:hypothetical protein
MPARMLVVTLAVLSLGGNAQAASPSPLRVLFVGNSLTATNDLPGIVAALGKASRFRDVEVRTLAPGGWAIEDHWRLGEAPRVLAAQRWNAIVLQQGPSALPASQVNLRTWATKIARAARAELYPAGDAWRAAWKRHPKLPLYGSDGFHPSRLGSYLAAVVIYAGLVKASPVGLPRLWVSAKRARVLQAAAAEALRRT